MGDVLRCNGAQDLYPEGGPRKKRASLRKRTRLEPIGEPPVRERTQQGVNEDQPLPVPSGQRKDKRRPQDELPPVVKSYAAHPSVARKLTRKRKRLEDQCLPVPCSQREDKRAPQDVHTPLAVKPYAAHPSVARKLRRTREQLSAEATAKFRQLFPSE